MKPSLIFRQYIWLVNTLRRHGRLSLDELNRLWKTDDMADGQPLSRSTFNRHRDAVLDMFGVVIDCDATAGYRYFIANPSVLQTDTVARWMLNTLTVGTVLADSVALQGRIMLEHVPAGEEYLPLIIRAMKKGQCLDTTYRRFGREEKTAVLQPYGLKLFERRWYLKAHNGKYVSTYSLDRIQRMTLSDETFRLPKDYTLEATYENVYGITESQKPKEDIRLRVSGLFADYLRTLPLHHSQQTDGCDAEGWTLFTLHLTPTNDLVHNLLRLGPNVEVIAPQSLRDEMARCLREAAALYE